MSVTAGAMLLLVPQTTERIVGDVRVKTEQLRRTIGGVHHPTVRLSGPGGQADLDACDGSFVHMESYEMPKLQPIFSAHNNCRGEVILPLQVGDVLAVDGEASGLWRVTDIRDLQKTWAFSEDLLGMDGQIILQTCYWGRSTMKFMAIEPLDRRDSGVTVGAAPSFGLQRGSRGPSPRVPFEV